MHDDVVPGAVLRRGTRVLRMSPAALAMMSGGTVTVTDAGSAALAGRLLDLDLAVPVLDEVGDDVAALLAQVTVVVPVRDRPAGVDRLLSSLRPALRCVVVDDGSIDARALADVAERHGAELLRLDVNRGPSAARNAGLRIVSTPLVAFVDSDVEVTADAVAGLVAHTADPALAAVSARVRSRGGQRWFERYEDAHGSLDLGPVPATVRPWSAVSYVPTACLLARVDALGAGFDEAMTSGEDVDLVWRLLGEGRRVRHAADVVVWHHGRTTLPSWLGRKWFYGTSAASLSRRHGELVTPAVLTPGAAALIGAALVQRRWASAIAAGVVARMLATTPGGVTPTERVAIVAGSVRTTSAQGAALALRHWWPVAAAACVVSRRARRFVAVAGAADAVVARARADTTLDVGRFALARRLDDVAYGTGVWSGAARDRSVRCLLPQWITPRRVSPRRAGPS
nr:mycofactocin biosynthesis glycosyltransferase MftF [Aeromicrobium sp. CFBP 8757]